MKPVEFGSQRNRHPGGSAAAWFRIASFPDKTAGNPHLQLFYKGLEAHGVELVTRLDCTPRWIRQHAGDLDGIHLHWPEKLWRGKRRGRLHAAIRLITGARYRAVLTVARALNVARRSGLKCLWTVHNIEPHDGSDWLDQLGYRIVARYANLIICYSQAAIPEVKARYRPRCEVVCVAHGNYAGVYPEPAPREGVMRKWGLDPRLPLVCCVGIIRPYKGLDIACQAIRKLDGTVQLAIAGAPFSQGDVDSLQSEMKSLHGALIARALTDQEFADLVAASEAVLLPYRRITGSGSLLAAWTLSRGVIASDLPLFREMLASHPDAGQVFRANDALSMAEAITTYLAKPSFARAAAADAASRAYAWDETVKPIISVLKKWMDPAIPPTRRDEHDAE